MYLYIRSQDKKKLEKLNKLSIICNDYEEKLNSRYNIYNDKSIIGTFKTEKRALEILDEIQKMLKDETIDKAVYEMPEE